MRMIVRALLQQRSLDSDQLQDTLPDYVPPTLKHSILHHFKTHTLQLLPPTPSASGSSQGQVTQVST